MTKRLIIQIGIAFVLLLLTLAYQQYSNHAGQLDRYARAVEQRLHDQLESMRSVMRQEVYFSKYHQQISRPYTVPDEAAIEQLDSLSKQAFSLFLFQSDSLLFWTKNEVAALAPALSALPTSFAPRILQLSNGQYLVTSKQLVVAGDTLQLVGALPVRWLFPAGSTYLLNQFAGLPSIPTHIWISLQQGAPIMDEHGQPWCYLQADRPIRNKQQQTLLFLLYLATFLSITVLVNRLARKLSRAYYPWVGSLFLLGSVVGLRVLLSALDFSKLFSDLYIFAHTFDTSVLNNSLGDLLINSFILLWLMVFFHREFSVLKPPVIPQRAKLLLSGLSYLIIISGLIVLTALIKSMVLDSGITFDFDNVFSLDIFDLLTIFSALIILIAFFLFAHRLMLTIFSIGLAQRYRWLTLLVAWLLGFPLLYLAQLDIPIIYLATAALLLLVCFDLYLDSNISSLTWLVLWLVLFSAFASILFYQYNLTKDLETRLNYARQLAEPRDLVAESEFQIFAAELMQSRFADWYRRQSVSPDFGNPALQKQLDQYLIDKSYLFNNYSYDLAIAPGTADDRLSNQWERWEAGFAAGSTIDIPGFRYWPDNKYGYVYLYRYPNTNQAGLAPFILSWRVLPSQASAKVYNELLPKAAYKNLDHLDQYEYSIYQYGTPITQINQVNENLMPYFRQLAEDQWIEIASGNWAHLIYKGKHQRTVIISKSLGGYVKPLSLFSYLFALLIFTVIILSVINHFIKALPSSLDLPVIGQSSLRSRLQRSIIFLILGSFIVIGLATITYFRNSSLDYHDNQLLKKAQAVQEDLQRNLQLQDGEAQKASDQLLRSVAEVHQTDIHCYDINGQLLASSADYVFERGWRASTMNPLALQALKLPTNTFMSFEEQIGGLKYKAAYLPLRANDQEIIGYVGLPYYSKDRNLRSDLVDFMGTLLNVYVFLLLVAGVIAIFVANSVTQPIAKIGEKLGRIQLGRNEPLDWKGTDEIGQLIGEYNNMISKLEESAEKLRQSEREGAWREMAKQVAHEIKNPLTPMKLNIQHLLRVHRSDPAQASELLERVSKNLIEQIETLSKIASEFSNFAKMPLAENDRFLLNELVGSIYTLFTENQQQDHQIVLDLSPYPIEVFADKSQVMRVLTNLVKNGLQAIPDQQAGEVRIRLYKKDGLAVVSVKDNGTGIPPAMREKVFYPNFTTKTSGMGLGLAISKSIIDAAGGRIYFETSSGRGTTFFVELPIYQPSDKA